MPIQAASAPSFPAASVALRGLDPALKEGLAMTKTRKVLRTLVVLGLVGGIAAAGAFSAFSSQTENPDNVVATGTVSLNDNDLDSPLYSIAAGRPGSTDEHCIRVNYTGSLPATVRIYRPDAVDANLAPHVNITIQPGTAGSFNCAGFNPDGAAIYNNTLSAMPTSYAASTIQDFPGSTTAWGNGDFVVYRVTATVSASAPNSAQGRTTGLHRLVWEAQNQ
jgi:hypothetical protein